jgi:hypothetical protein
MQYEVVIANHAANGPVVGRMLNANPFLGFAVGQFIEVQGAPRLINQVHHQLITPLPPNPVLHRIILVI